MKNGVAYKKNVYFMKRVDPVLNGLTEDIVDAPRVDCFKKRLDVFWNDL